MSNRTWCCVSCRKTYRRTQTITAVECPASPRCVRIRSLEDPHAIAESKEGVRDSFWTRYRAEKCVAGCPLSRGIAT